MSDWQRLVMIDELQGVGMWWCVFWSRLKSSSPGAGVVGVGVVDIGCLDCDMIEFQIVL